jgi:hypothetical protein
MSNQLSDVLIALSSLQVPSFRVTIPYHFKQNITVRPSIPRIGHCKLFATVQNEERLQVLTASVFMGTSTTVTVQHVGKDGLTRLRLIADSQ